MKKLLDSHIVIWSLTSPKELSPKARKLLANTDIQFWVSEASIIEMAIKINIGKLTYKGGLRELLLDIDTAKFQVLSLERNHLLEYEKLPLHHRDPFDRLIIAQSIYEKAGVISKDPFFEKYGIEVIW